MKRKLLVGLLIVLIAVGAGWFLLGRERAELDIAQVMGPQPRLVDPERQWFPTVNVAKAVGWKAGEMPTPAAGLRVNAFASGLDHPRWLLALPNGDVLVAESNAPPKEDKGGGIRGWAEDLLKGQAGATVESPNRIVLLRDANGDGVAEVKTNFLTGLNSPFGMALVGDQLYVANTDAIVRFPYRAGATSITVPGVKLVDLPGGPINHHWTKNLIASPDGSRLYATVGSNSNVGEKGRRAEDGRAAIWEIDPKTGSHRIFAYGLRNPNGMAWNPTSGALWTVVNERDEIGSDIVPDYLTSVQFGGFYGWPDFYWGGYPDTRVEDIRMEQQGYVIRPDYALGPHTASLGLTFADTLELGPRFAQGAFIGQHGSWNRRPFSGYKVLFVPFAGGRPSGPAVDVLTGFLSPDEEARGRPVGVIAANDGALLVADDVGNAIWRVTPADAGARTAAR